MNYYIKIKEELINNEITKRVKDYSKNKSDLYTCFNVGKLLFEAGKHYGDGIIKEYSKMLMLEVDKKYSSRNLFNFRLFYFKFKNYEKVNTLCSQLTWSHYRELLWINDYNKINYYINVSNNQNLSVRQLKDKIKNKEYERLDEKTKQKLINREETNVEDFVKNPILIKNNYNYTEWSEKILKKLILEDLSSFMKELGDGFSYIDQEYKIKIGSEYNFIDLLLYNIIFKCYVVIELKITELKAEYIGQIAKYMNYINKNIKTINEDNTIGVIICKKDNKFIMEYCSDKRIFSKKYLII